jgi:hypothetical protein
MQKLRHSYLSGENSGDRMRVNDKVEQMETT